MITTGTTALGWGSVPNVGPTHHFADGVPDDTFPAPQETTQGITLTFTDPGASPTDNTISVTDPDALLLSPFEVELKLWKHGTETLANSATEGTLSLSINEGLSFSIGGHQNVVRMQFQGDLPDINTALDGMTFTPAAGFIGRVDLRIETNDQGHDGKWVNNQPDEILDLDTVVINVIPATIAMSGAVEDTPYTVSNSDLANAAFPGGKYAGENVTFHIEPAASGTLTKDGIAAEEDGTVTIGENEEVVWHPEANVSGSAVHAFMVSFSDSTGWRSSPIPVEVDVQATDHAPAVVIKKGNGPVGDTVLAARVGDPAINLTAAVTNPSGLTTTIGWTQIRGPASGASFSPDDNVMTGVTFSAAGQYVLRVEVSDTSNPGLSDFADVTFDVTPQNPAPGPTIAFTMPNDTDSVIDNNTAAVVLRADADPGAGGSPIDGVVFHVYRNPNQLVATLDGAAEPVSGDYVADWSPGAEELYLVRATATDAAGLTSSTIRVLSVQDSAYKYLPDVLGESAQELIAGLTAGDNFGHAVAISGDLAVIGAPTSGTKGSAKFIRYSGMQWENAAFQAGVGGLGLTDIKGTARFGHAVDIDGNWAVVSARDHTFTNTQSGAEHPNAGKIHLFLFDQNAQEWVPKNKIEAPGTYQPTRTDHRFGSSVAIQGTTLVVGAEGDEGDGDIANGNEGRVYVYEYSGGVWSRTADLVASNPLQGANFGSSVAIDGNTIAVGAKDYKVADASGIQSPAGAVFLFERDEPGGSWVETRRLTAPSPQANAKFGGTVALNGSSLVVGEFRRNINLNETGTPDSNVGAVYVYDRSGGSWSGGVPISTSELIPGSEVKQAGEFFGISLAIEADTALVGASLHDLAGGADAGVVHVFRSAGDRWVYAGSVTSDTAEANDEFGAAVAMSDARVIVGAARDAIPAGYAAIVSRAPTVRVAMTHPSDEQAFTYGQPVVLEALAFDPDGGAISSVNFQRDGQPWKTAVFDAATQTYQYTFSADAPGTILQPGIYSITAKATDDQSNTRETSPVEVLVYSADTSPGLHDTDLDNIEDSKELLYFGTLDADITLQQVDAIEAGRDPLVGNDDPQISSVFPRIGEAIATPLSDGALALTVNTINTPSGTVKIEDRFGNDITSHAFITQNGLEMVLDIDPSDPDNAGVSEYLSGITQQFTVTVDDPDNSAPAKSYNIYFRVDTSLPVVTAKPGGGRVSDASIDVELEASEEVQKIEYQFNGSGTWATYSAELNIAAPTVLSFRAVDMAGNTGPTGTEYYAFGDELNQVTGFVAGYNPDSKHINCSWDEWDPAGSQTPIVGYHIYRAINPVDVRRLQESLDKGYPPPHYLRLTGSSSAIAHQVTTFTDTDVTPGMTAWYGVTVTTADGNESVISDLVQVTSDPADPAEPEVSLAEAARRATRWLLANQAEAGYWGDDPGKRVIATAQALNALGRVDGFTADHPDVIERGLAYLAGHFEDNNDAIARAADTLQRYGRDTTGLHEKHKFRSMKDTDTPTNIQGWGLQQRYYPDPLHTALGAVARRTAGFGGQPMDDIVGFLKNTLLQSIVGTGDRYGWVPRNNDSIYVSTLVYRATDQHHPRPTPVYQWVLDEQAAAPAGNRPFRDNILDTAATLLYLPVPETDRLDAKGYLAKQQADNGSWEDDAFLTALCLEAIADRNALLLRGPNTLSASALEVAMRQRGFDVTTMDTASSVDLSQAGDYQLILVSGNANVTSIGTGLRGVEVPVIVCASGLYEKMAMAGPGADDSGVSAAVTSISNDVSSHPLAAGISTASVTVFDTATSISWAKPVNGRAAIATLPSDSTMATIFAYETNDPMAGGHRAPARRVGFFLDDDANQLTDDGAALLDAAIEWITIPITTP